MNLIRENYIDFLTLLIEREGVEIKTIVQCKQINSVIVMVEKIRQKQFTTTISII